MRITLELPPRRLAAGLALLAVGFAAGRLDSENLTMSTTYPAPSGVYQKIISTDQAALARDNGNVGIGTANPTGLPSPINGHTKGNLDVNDIYVRSTGKWLSQLSVFGAWTDYGKAFNVIQSAPSDGIVMANIRIPTGAFLECLNPAGNPIGNGAVVRQVVSGSVGVGNACAGLEDYACTMVVKKGDNWAVRNVAGGTGTCGDDHIWFMALKLN